jgi:hypothetical protein
MCCLYLNSYNSSGISDFLVMAAGMMATAIHINVKGAAIGLKDC